MFDWLEWQTNFYGRACADSRLSPTHISLYYALVHEAGHQYAIPFFLNKTGVMQKAKICSPVTFYRLMKELDAYGFIEYGPSFKTRRSWVAISNFNYG